MDEELKSVRSLIQIRIKKTQWVYEHSLYINLKNPYVAKHLSLLHDKYVIVFVDKAPINIVFVCKSHYIKALGIGNSLCNPTKNVYPDDTYERGNPGQS